VLYILDYPDNTSFFKVLAGNTSFFKVLAGLETACETIVLLYPVIAPIEGFVKL